MTATDVRHLNGFMSIQMVVMVVVGERGGGEARGREATKQEDNVRTKVGKISQLSKHFSPSVSRSIFAFRFI